MLWVIDAERRRVAVHSPSAPTRWLDERDPLEGEDVVRGFTMPVADPFDGLAHVVMAGSVRTLTRRRLDRVSDVPSFRHDVTRSDTQSDPR